MQTTRNTHSHTHTANPFPYVWLLLLLRCCAAAVESLSADVAFALYTYSCVHVHMYIRIWQILFSECAACVCVIEYLLAPHLLCKANKHRKNACAAVSDPDNNGNSKVRFDWCLFLLFLSFSGHYFGLHQRPYQQHPHLHTYIHKCVHHLLLFFSSAKLIWYDLNAISALLRSAQCNAHKQNHLMARRRANLNDPSNQSRRTYNSVATTKTQKKKSKNKEYKQRKCSAACSCLGSLVWPDVLSSQTNTHIN